MRSFLVVTIRSIKEHDVDVTLVFSVTMFYMLNISKIEHNFPALVFSPQSSFEKFKSQLKSPTIFHVFNQAFSRGDLIKSKNWLASGGL